MMKFTIFLLSAVLIPAQLILAGQGYIDEAKVKKMINDAVSQVRLDCTSVKSALASCSAVSHTRTPAQLFCTDVKRKGALARCPPGYKVTGCACGYGCGFWDIRRQVVCHCQCAGMDWTTARCCKIG